MQSVNLFSEPLQSLAFGDISGTYALLGTLANPSQVYLVQNLSNATMTFSYDGTTDNFQLPALGYIILDVGTNKGNFQSLSVPQGTSISVKGVATGGQVNLSTWYMG